jgi:NTP pyrophosphatase (non-canonical NTP hydrolase)
MDDFTSLCKRTESGAVPLGHQQLSRLLHAAMGIATEAGEFMDPLKKALFYDKQIDEVNLREEIGDLLWYIAIACDALDTTPELEMARVVAKLRVRYPDKFSDTEALNRNLEAERAVLEQPNGSAILV